MRVLTLSDAELDKLEIIRDVDLERMPARLCERIDPD